MNIVSQICLNSDTNEGNTETFKLKRKLKGLKSLSGLFGDISFSTTLDEYHKSITLIYPFQTRYEYVSPDSPYQLEDYPLWQERSNYVNYDLSDYLTCKLSAFNLISILNNITISKPLSVFHLMLKRDSTSLIAEGVEIDALIPKFFINKDTNMILLRWYRFSLDLDLIATNVNKSTFDSRINSLKSYPQLITVFEALEEWMNEESIRKIQENVTGVSDKHFVSDYIPSQVHKLDTFGFVSNDDMYRVLGLSDPFETTHDSHYGWYRTFFTPMSTVQAYHRDVLVSSYKIDDPVRWDDGKTRFKRFITLENRNLNDEPQSVIGTNKKGLAEGSDYNTCAGLYFSCEPRINHGIDYLYIGLKNLKVNEGGRFLSNIEKLKEERIFLVVDVRERDFPKRTFETSLPVISVMLGDYNDVDTLELEYYAHSGHFGGFRKITPTSVKIKIKPVFLN